MDGEGMIIMSQSGDKIIDWSKVNKVYLVGNSVVIGMSDKDYSTYGKYRTNEQANLVLGRLFYALVEGEKQFQFPQPSELPDSKAHYGSGGGKRHGGS